MSAPAESPRYFAFISYSHRDEQWAQWLHKALETYRVPSRLVGQTTAAGAIPRRLLPIFRDREELASSSDLGRTVNAALAQSRNLIVVCSPASAQSRWVNEEVLAFKRLFGGERIFCLIVDGEPDATDMPGRAAEECFAPALRYALGADGQPTPQRTEPIAADAREGKDGKANAKLKLVAGMLEVGFDALKQRELQRRNRRMAIVTAVALVIMAITTTLAITAVIARNDAQRRQKQAEDLVSFMLGDLNDKLGEVKRQDILQAVDDKAMEYFASLPVEDVTDAALEQRVIALEKIGSVRMEQGQIPAAQESYGAASTLAAELSRRAPGDVSRQVAYADSMKWLGQGCWYKGDLTCALEHFRAAAALLQTASAAKVDDASITFKLALVRNNVGHVLEAKGDFDGAQPEYDATLALYQSLSAREPDNSKWQSYLGDAWNNLGKLALEQGKLEAALSAYRRDQRTKETLAERDATNHDAQENLLLSNAILGRTLALCGETEAALRYTSAAVEAARRLTAFDTTNLYWQEDLGFYSQQMGGLLRQLGHLEKATAAVSEGVGVLSEIVAKDSSNAQWQRELAQSELERARLSLAQGNLREAKDQALAATKSIVALRDKHKTDLRFSVLAAQALILSGDIAYKSDDKAAAQDFSMQARDALSPALRTGSDPNILAAAVSADVMLGNVAEAKGMIAALARMGYRNPDFVALLAARHVDYAVDADAAQRISEVIK